LEFRVSDTWGMGAWFARQAESVSRMTPAIGYSPPSAAGNSGRRDVGPHSDRSTAQPVGAEEPKEYEAPEELT